MAAKWQRMKIAIPPKYKPADREVIAQEIIDYIVDRTLQGVDKKGKEFKPLSPEYKAKNKALGAGGKADLKLSGDMLGALDLISDKSGQLLIGFENGTEENDKADGHITGNVGVKRDFFGITQKKVKEIIKELEEIAERRENR